MAKKSSEKEAKVKEEELKKKLEEELKRLTVKDVVTQMMITLGSLGYQKLGLPKETQKKFKDLNQARLAIDSLQALIKVVEKSFLQEELKAFKTTLANLQLSYVRESKS